MAGAKEISIEKHKLFDFKDKKVEQMSVVDTHMLDCLNDLYDHETNVDKIAKTTHEFLLLSSIKDPQKEIEECIEDGKIFCNVNEKNKKIAELTAIFYEEKLKMLKQHLLKEEYFLFFD